MNPILLVHGLCISTTMVAVGVWAILILRVIFASISAMSLASQSLTSHIVLYLRMLSHVVLPIVSLPSSTFTRRALSDSVLIQRESPSVESQPVDSSVLRWHTWRVTQAFLLSLLL